MTDKASPVQQKNFGFLRYTEETHNSVYLKGLYDALAFTSAEWRA